MQYLLHVIVLHDRLPVGSGMRYALVGRRLDFIGDALKFPDKRTADR